MPTADEVEAETKRVEDALNAAMPEPWKEGTDESDYDLIALTLDRMEAAAGAGQYRQAEQARLEAYAFFEFGPERRLKAFDPGLALDIEGAIWFGAGDQPGLATLIADRAPRRELRKARLALDEQLADAAATLGDSASSATVVTNSAILVFREGLEAVLILAAITASFVGVRRRLRRPVMVGALLGLLASILTWVIASTLIESLATSGEKLEAITGLVAIAVLLLVTNWFFHRVYWSEWIGRFHRRRKTLEKIDRTGFISAQVVGFVLLGLTSVYREGFETVLFLQALQVSAGTATVVEGAALGLALTFAVGAVTFLLQRKLPVQADADRDRRDDRLRARRHGRPDRAHDAGRRLAADQPDRRRAAVLARRVVRRLSDVGDDRRAGRRRRLRDRLLLRGAGDEGQAARAPCPAPRRIRATDTTASAVITTALATHH